MDKYIPEQRIGDLGAGEDRGTAPNDGPVKVKPGPLSTDEANRLRELANGPKTLRYAGSLVISSSKIMEDIARSGIPDINTGW